MEWCKISEAGTRVYKWKEEEQKKERLWWVRGTRGLTGDVGKMSKHLR